MMLSDVHVVQARSWALPVMLGTDVSLHLEHATTGPRWASGWLKAWKDHCPAHRTYGLDLGRWRLALVVQQIRQMES